MSSLVLKMIRMCRESEELRLKDVYCKCSIIYADISIHIAKHSDNSLCIRPVHRHALSIFIGRDLAVVYTDNVDDQ